MDVAAAFAGLAGLWRLAREIPDQGRMSGEAVFTQGDDRRALQYRETGTLELPDGRRLDVFRAYTWRLLGDGRIAIDFADGATPGARFVTLDFAADEAGGLQAADSHLCGADLYEATIRLDLPQAFSTDIRVRGPRKDYRAITRCHRS
ncbi:DUF6314 family protein [Tistrella mobilis]|uniref:DUF6314 domain-containing protein n=1 Tax=Tistrella mobilis TaxID=171437 RepID=A0A162KDW3_9PROT|nr:DUF6314 family protein [Tistrella mobilis]KYO51041.1 hypothetical protein AUP44_10360 [Tistrella mobilis]